MSQDKALEKYENTVERLKNEYVLGNISYDGVCEKENEAWDEYEKQIRGKVSQ